VLREVVDEVERSPNQVVIASVLQGSHRVALAEPALFHRFIATSPSVVEAGQVMLDRQRWPAPNSLLDGRLCVSIGSAADEYPPRTESFVTERRDPTIDACSWIRRYLPVTATSTPRPLDC